MRRFPKFARFMRERLGSRRDALHGRLAEYLGVHPSQVTAYKDGQSPSLVRCIQIARFFGEDAGEVAALVGKGEELRATLGLVEGVLRGELASAGESDQGAAGVPVMGHAEAGEVELACEYTDRGFPPGAADDHLSPAAELADPNAYALVIRGEGMEPLFGDGDRVVVSPARPFVPRRLYVVRSREGQVWLRRVERHGDTYSLLSVNPAYPPIYLNALEVSWLHAVTWVRFR
jgi:SOS-response transcriptional repressor LexA